MAEQLPDEGGVSGVATGEPVFTKLPDVAVNDADEFSRPNERRGL
ncbi:hypothetical protein [Bradyrhizobium sp. BR 10261]|nr:hypothetical protein [Bradyrhizobium sp. BR 10261]